MKDNIYSELNKEDYIEAACLLCGVPGSKGSGKESIPEKRIIEKVDEFMANRDYSGVERLLDFWYGEAKALGDERGLLLVLNEKIGHFRKTGERDKCLAAIDEALDLVPKIGMEDTVSGATTYVNAATALNSVGENERSYGLFRMAEPIYEKNPEQTRHLVAGLYNNMALSLTALSRYDEAWEYYMKALDANEKENDLLESAITCLNAADLVCIRDGMEKGEKEVFSLLDKAYELLFSPGIPENGYKAFVFEKCAPVFTYYGYFDAYEKIKAEYERIYAKEGNK